MNIFYKYLLISVFVFWNCLNLEAQENAPMTCISGCNLEIKSYPIAERGKGTVTIQGSEFTAGMYLYALIADGKVIDTKRMILTK